MALSTALMLLSGVALVLSTGSWAYSCGDKPGSRWQVSDQVHWWMFVLVLFGGVVGYVVGLLSDIMLVLGFAYCGRYVFMSIALAIIVGSQSFSAWEFAFHEKGSENRYGRFALGLLQGRVFIEAFESWRLQEITPCFARQKFLDSIGESGPLAIFAVYALYFFDQKYDLSLQLSVFLHTLSLAVGIMGFLAFTFKRQLLQEGIPHSVFAIKWYHYVSWTCYFSTDFSLRLLTLGTFLATPQLKPYNQAVFLLLLILYALAVALAIRSYQRSQAAQVEFWQISEDEVIEVRRKIVVQRVIDALILTYLVHVLPADMRLAPRETGDSRLLFALHPEVRRKIMRAVIPLRAAEYLLLGGAALAYNFDGWQCASLVFMWVAMHIMLAQVLWLRGPPVPEDNQRPPADLTPSLAQKISGLDGRSPASAKGEDIDSR